MDTIPCAGEGEEGAEGCCKPAGSSRGASLRLIWRRLTERSSCKLSAKHAHTHTASGSSPTAFGPPKHGLWPTQARPPAHHGPKPSTHGLSPRPVPQGLASAQTRRQTRPEGQTALTRALSPDQKSQSSKQLVARSCRRQSNQPLPTRPPQLETSTLASTPSERAPTVRPFQCACPKPAQTTIRRADAPKPRGFTPWPLTRATHPSLQSKVSGWTTGTSNAKQIWKTDGAQHAEDSMDD